MSDVQHPEKLGGRATPHVVALTDTTHYGSLLLRPCRDDRGDDGNITTVSSLSFDEDRIDDDDCISIPPSRHRQLLHIVMFALPLFMGLVLLRDFIQQQTVISNAASAPPSVTRRKSIAMYGRAKFDGNNGGDDDVWIGNGNDESSKNNDHDWKYDEWCNANRFRCAACDGKWCATDAPPSAGAAMSTTTTSSIGSASAGYCIW
jgi:hypothetical protein